MGFVSFDTLPYDVQCTIIAHQPPEVILLLANTCKRVALVAFDVIFQDFPCRDSIQKHLVSCKQQVTDAISLAREVRNEYNNNSTWWKFALPALSLVAPELIELGAEHFEIVRGERAVGDDQGDRGRQHQHIAAERFGAKERLQKRDGPGRVRGLQGQYPLLDCCGAA